VYVIINQQQTDRQSGKPTDGCRLTTRVVIKLSNQNKTDKQTRYCVLHKAEYSAFESTLSSSIVSYVYNSKCWPRLRQPVSLLVYHCTSWRQATVMISGPWQNVGVISDLFSARVCLRQHLTAFKINIRITFYYDPTHMHIAKHIVAIKDVSPPVYHVDTKIV